MDADRYQRAIAIFHDAVDLPASERSAFVERACGGDADLAREVLSLLAHDSGESDFLETPAVSQPTRTAGSRVGPYEIVEAIGGGGMGDVFRARDPRFGRDVAIKFLPPEFARDAERVARFEREAMAAGPINHPNILTVHDSGRDAGVPYLVSELLHGETLRARLAGGPMRPAAAVACAAQMARGLGAAHARGIVHRDVKPENVFITDGGVPKILDFGLARIAVPPAGGASGSGATLTQAGMVMGTFGYMSPEQIRGEPADARSDLFSLGVVLYEMLTGTRPFAAATWAEESSAILTRETPELPQALAGIPDAPALSRVLRRCLAKPADDRFQSARDLAFALESVLDAGVPAPRPARRRLAMWAAAAGLVGLAAAAVALVVFLNQAGPATSFQRLTFRRGTVSAARFSPDGTTIVYSAAWDTDPFRLFFTRTDSTESRLLTETPGMLFAVSARSEVAICRPTGRTQHGFIGTLARLPLSGGGAVDVAENVSAADWSPDGSLAVVRVDGDRSRIEWPVFHSVYVPQGSGGYMEALRVSPNGQMAAFFDHPLMDDSAGYVATVDRTGKYTVLSSRFNSMRSLAWSPDGREIWFAATKHGTNLAVWAVRLSDRRQRLVAPFPAYVSLEDISRDGRTLLSFHTLVNSLIHVTATGDQRELYWHDQSQAQDISRDGRTILFSESGDATRDDYEAYVRGIDPSSPASRLGVGLPLSMSPDGRWVIANPAGRPAPLTLLPNGPGEPRTLAADAVNHLGAAWMPDGKRVVFAGVAGADGLRYYVQPVAGGTPRPISPAVLFERRSPVVVSPDGGFVAAVAPDRRVTLYPTGDGAPRTLPGLEPGFTPLRWCADGHLVGSRHDDPTPRLWTADIDSGRSTVWRDIRPPNLVGLLDLTPIRVSPDCQSYAFSPLNVLSQVYLASGLR